MWANSLLNHRRNRTSDSRRDRTRVRRFRSEERKARVGGGGRSLKLAQPRSSLGTKTSLRLCGALRSK